MGQVISAYFSAAERQRLGLSAGSPVPGADVLLSPGTMAKRALEQSRATVGTTIACAIAWLWTSAWELRIPHMEVAFGDCKLLPVIGGKR